MPAPALHDDVEARAGRVERPLPDREGAERLIDHQQRKFLAQDAEQDRHAEAMEKAQSPDQVEVVLQRLAEPDAGVEPDPFAVDSGGGRALDAVPQRAVNLRNNVVVAGVGLHVLGGPAPVHEDEGGLRTGHELEHAGLGCRSHIVDEVGSSVHRG